MLEHVCFLVDGDHFKYLTSKMTQALVQRDVRVTVVDTEGSPLSPDQFSFFKTDRPNLTCSFNTFNALPSGKFLWDVLEIPHLALLDEPAFYSFHLAKSPLTIFSVCDREDLAILNNENQKVIFLPLAVGSDVAMDVNNKRPLDVVFFGSCYDFDALRNFWKENLSSSHARVVDFAIDIMLTDNKSSVAEALRCACSAARLDLKEIDVNFLFFCIDKFVRGKDQVELISSIKNADVHVYGGKAFDLAGAKSWEHYLGNKKNITVHDTACFGKSLEILKQSKICLNSTTYIRDGAHEGALLGLACGASVIASESTYMREFFIDEEDLFYYKSKHWHEVGEKIDFLLSDEKGRREMVHKGREKVLEHHTWDKRVDSLLKELPPLLSRASEILSRKAGNP